MLFNNETNSSDSAGLKGNGEIKVNTADTSQDTASFGAQNVFHSITDEEILPSKEIETKTQKKLVKKKKNYVAKTISIEANDRKQDLKMNHQCPVCNVRSSSSSFLKAHIVSKRERQCPECNLYFQSCQMVLIHKKGRCRIKRTQL
jgi:transcription elongation factor Elf1